MTGQVLVADDDAEVRQALERELTDAGYTVVLACDAQEALAQARTSEFDVVVTDLRMPGAGGLDVVHEVKQSAPDTEVVVVTGHPDMHAALACLRAGAFDFIVKPFVPSDVVRTVARAVERGQLRATTQLYEASQAILAAREAQDLHRAIVQVTMKVMGADDASLMLLGSDQRLHMAYSHCLARTNEVPAPLELGERVAGRIAQSRRAALIEDRLGDDPRFADLTSVGRVRSSIVQPLLAGDRLVGVLNINRFGGRRFRRADVERAAILASQVVLALDNIRLVADLMVTERLASIGLLATSIAHEIANPMAAVVMGLDLLEQKLAGPGGSATGMTESAALTARAGAPPESDRRMEPAELASILEDVRSEAEHIQDIVRDLRSLAGTNERDRSLVDLNEIVRSALRVGGTAVRRQAEVVTHFGADVWVHATAGRLVQVFINLVVNAAQAMDEARSPRRQISITTRREGERVVAEVADTGPGVRPEHLTRLFEPFFTTKQPGTGIGLGLSISRDIVHRHGGEIRVTSRSGQGAVFAVDLPAGAIAGGPRPRSAASAASGQGD
jgi:C4-dicarboxylate-specific signal transduction histidine kinase